MLFKKVFLFVLALGLFATSQASADVVTYGAQAAFNAATTGATTVNWEGIIGTGTYASVASPYTHDGVVVSNAGGLFVVDHTWGFTSSVIGPAGSSATTIAIPASQTAMGVEFHFGSQLAEIAGTINLSDTTTASFSILRPTNIGTGFDSNTPVFFGAASSNPSVTILSFTLAPSALDSPFLGPVSYGTAAPEPGSIVLLVMGLMGLLAYAWRKKK